LLAKKFNALKDIKARYNFIIKNIIYMKVVILAGGKGTRISEESINKPKPLIEIGSKPIIWHIMKHYSHFGLNDFIICCGYKGYLLKEYFANYYMHNSDITIDLKNNNLEIKKTNSEPWKISLVDTGENTMTGGRILKIKDILKKEKDFCLTYGDGVSNINIKKLIDFHKRNKKLATITVVKPQGRYGMINLNKNNLVEKFAEKPDGDGSWVNGGFFVFNQGIFNFLKKDSDILEQGPIQKISKKKQLSAYKHLGFWKAMDTLNDKNYLEDLWSKSKCPWKIW
jgi:glucose-1-phosphate cytidylyltransferase